MDNGKKSEVDMIENRKDDPASVPQNSELIEQEGAGVPAGYWYSPRFIGSTVAIVLLANNLFIGYAMPTNVLNVINADLGPDSSIYLASLINTLIKGVFLLLVGSISDVLGRRYFIIAGQALGLVGAIIAATSKNINTLIGANVFIGLGGATQVLYPLLIMEIVPNKHRGTAQSLITLSAFPSMGLGPGFARMMVEYTALGWRYVVPCSSKTTWVYWLNAITVGTSLVLFFVCYFPPDFDQLSQGTSKKDQLKNIDVVAWGGRQYTWGSAQVVATLVIGIVVLVSFVLYEIYMAPRSPLVPMNLFKITNYNVAVIVGSVGQMSFYALNVIWPQQVTNLYTTDNIKIGWMSCTTGAALAFGEVLTGPLCKKGMRVKLQMFLSMTGLCIFCGIMSLGNESREALSVAMTVVIGLFVGWIELICIVVASLVIPPEHIGSGTAFFASFRAITGTIATSIYVAIQTNQYNGKVGGYVSEAATDAGFAVDGIPELLKVIAKSTTARAIGSVPGMTESISQAVTAAIKRAYAQSYSTVYLSSLAFGGVALVSCFFATHDMEEYFTSFLNKTVDAPYLQNVGKGSKQEDAEN
uniref:Major facilitator superfamily (MFS) profile domain-containing protein n=1 Tax=Bionectria ochroleuca TaxID=29856 RepID=A0A8H7K351_BIOOC